MQNTTPKVCTDKLDNSGTANSSPYFDGYAHGYAANCAGSFETTTGGAFVPEDACLGVA